MKNRLLAAGLLLLLATGCVHPEPSSTMTIVRDCTGTYLRLDGKDYHVCNTEKTGIYPPGARVNASIKKISTCSALSDEPVCKLYHANEGWVWVSSIR
jgi:hypothetical protein